MIGDGGYLGYAEESRLIAAGVVEKIGLSVRQSPCEKGSDRLPFGFAVRHIVIVLHPQSGLTGVQGKGRIVRLAVGGGKAEKPACRKAADQNDPAPRLL